MLARRCASLLAAALPLEDFVLVTAGFEVIGTGRNTSGLTPPAGVTFLDLDVTRAHPAGRLHSRTPA